ncbi:M48 family metallopeptidase [Myxococcota bacterium]|nr:M48 family metallopeptidase [Myxococcota bacterium]
MERSAVHFGKTEIAYAIERGRRQKTVAIAIDPVRGIWVRAPLGTPIGRLDQIVTRKAKWILDRQRRVEDLPPAPSPREFVNGETLRYLGRQYRLKLDRDPAAAERGVRLIGGQLIVPVARRSNEASEIRDQLVGWYREHAAAHIPGRVKVWAGKIGVEPREILIRDQRKRWGSADAEGRIRINWRIIQASTRLLDYVVAHELVHLKYPDHTRAFWADLGQLMGDYEGRREELRRLGREISW